MNKSFWSERVGIMVVCFCVIFVPLFLQPAAAAAERGENTSVVPEIIAYRLLLPQF
jgi:hypothetical protein